MKHSAKMTMVCVKFLTNAVRAKMLDLVYDLSKHHYDMHMQRSDDGFHYAASLAQFSVNVNYFNYLTRVSTELFEN